MVFENSSNNSKKKGFTLVELIVVLGVAVAITGVLFVAIDPQAILAKSRDAQRIQDLDELSTGLQLALDDASIVLEDTKECQECTSITGSARVDGTGWVKFEVLEGKTGLKEYLPHLPLDPLNVSPYVYKIVVNGESQKFKIAVPLESPDNANRMRLDEGTDPNLYEVGTDLDLSLDYNTSGNAGETNESE
jgi:hypothetical protein